MQTNEQLLAKAWLARETRNFDNCLEVMKQLRQKSEADVKDQVALLDASILRANSEIAQSQELIKKIEASCLAEGRLIPFQLYYQRGLNFYALDELSAAMEYFIKAKRVTSFASEKLICNINTLLCLESLGLPLATVQSELEILIEDDQVQDRKKGVQSILQIFKMRQKFRHGNFDSLYARSNKQISLPNQKLTQGEYYLMWLSELPYLKVRYDQFDYWLEQLSVDSDFYLKNHRLKTLSPEKNLLEESRIPIKEQVDRIYLWTWRWLMNPNEVHRQYLREALMDLQLKASYKKMTCEDVQMLKNSFSWLSLYQPKIKEAFRTMIALLQSQPVPSFEIFEYENLWIKLAAAIKAKDSKSVKQTRYQISRHKLNANKKIVFADIFENLASGLQQKRIKKDVLMINPVSGKLQNQQVHLSLPLAKFIAELVQRQRLTFSQALEIGFQISPFEKGVHEPKIYNLISRAKKLLPAGLSLKTKDENIFLIGDRKNIIIESDLAHEIPILDDDAVKCLLENNCYENSGQALIRYEYVDRWVHPRIILKRSLGKRNLSRHELQVLTKASKATTSRWINKWIEQGLISKSGIGKSTMYHIEIT